MKKTLLVGLLLGSFAISSCSSSGSNPATNLTLPTGLSLASYLQLLVSDLGNSDLNNYNAVSSTANSGNDVLTLIDSFFSAMDGVTIESGVARVIADISSGTLKISFSQITQITADINMDGTAETITCSGTSTASSCAYLWLDDTPFALLVVTAYASGSDLGSGLVTFIPSRIDSTVDADVSISAVWGGDGTIRATDAYFVGMIASDFTSDKGRLKVGYDEGVVKTQESSDWTAHPYSCDATQAALAWEQDAGAYISTAFALDAVCPVPNGVSCLTISTSSSAPSVDNCAVFAVTDADVMTIPTSSATAELPADFPATPTF
jgi:hypothetical protein